MIYYRLFPNCVLVKGLKRSTICDLQRGRLLLIPNKLYEILDYIKKTDTTNIEVLEKKYSCDSTGLKKYLKHLIDEDFLCLTTYPSRFMELNTEFEIPSSITNSIIDIDDDSKFNLDNLNKILETGCNVYQIRFLRPISESKISNMIELFNNHDSVKVLEVILPYSSKNKVHTKKINKITNFVFYKSKIQKIIYNKKTESMINYITSEYDENKCGVINMDSFSVNIQMFTESLSFNNCLNKKLGIDRSGYVKNCPSFKNNFGHIENIKLNELFLNKKFINYWKIKKDDIKVCKTCEFRYICSDCRVFTTKNQINGKPSKCNYNPATNEWCN